METTKSTPTTRTRSTSTAKKKRARTEISDPVIDEDEDLASAKKQNTTTPTQTQTQIPRVASSPWTHHSTTAVPKQPPPLKVASHPGAKLQLSSATVDDIVQAIPPPPFSSAFQQEQQEPPVESEPTPTPTRTYLPSIPPVVDESTSTKPSDRHLQSDSIDVKAPPSTPRPSLGQTTRNPSSSTTLFCLLVNALVVLTLGLSLLTGLLVHERIEHQLQLLDLKQVMSNYQLWDDNHKARDEFYLKELREQVRSWKLESKGTRAELDAYRNQVLEFVPQQMQAPNDD
jgi:hypothetical protein